MISTKTALIAFGALIVLVLGAVLIEDSSVEKARWEAAATATPDNPQAPRYILYTTSGEQLVTAYQAPRGGLLGSFYPKLGEAYTPEGELLQFDHPYEIELYEDENNDTFGVDYRDPVPEKRPEGRDNGHAAQ